MLIGTENAADPATYVAARRRDVRERRRAVAALIAGAIIIGSVPILVRWSEVGAIATAFWRMAIAGGLALILLRPWHTRRTACSIRLVAGLGFCGLLFAADLATFHLAIGATTVANASLLNNLAPLFAGVLAMILGRPTGARFWLGMGCALIGVAMLFIPKLDRSSTELVGLGTGLASAIFFAGYLLVVERLRGVCSTVAIIGWTGLASAIVLLPAAWAAGERLLPVTVNGWLVLAALAIVAHGAGQALVIYALARLSGPEAGVGMLLQVVAAAMLGALLLGETIGLALVIGGAAVLLGVIVATTRQS